MFVLKYNKPKAVYLYGLQITEMGAPVASAPSIDRFAHSTVDWQAPYRKVEKTRCAAHLEQSCKGASSGSDKTNEKFDLVHFCVETGNIFKEKFWKSINLSEIILEKHFLVKFW